MRPSLRRALDWWARNRHPLLFALLIATIAIGPLLSIIGSGGWLLDTCLGLTLLVAAIMPMRDRVGGRGFIAFVIAAVIVGLLPNRTPLGDVGPFTMIVWAGIAFFAAMFPRGHQLFDYRTEVDRLELGAGELGVRTRGFADVADQSVEADDIVFRHGEEL